jgi:predicted TIM-barrel fold metal-dependent hydrolase
VLRNPAHRAFALLRHLQHVNWRATARPAIIAHAGFYGHSLDEVRGECLPLLLRMLDAHPHLLVETSGLALPVLELLLRAVDSRRMLFGSDALYFSQWAEVVKVWHAMNLAGVEPGKTFAAIAGSNPARVIWGDWA